MIKLILREFLENSDVQSAAVSGLDGFVIEMVKNENIDSDAVGAMTSTSVKTFEDLGAGLKRGKLKRAILAHAKGHVILSPLTEEEYVVITAKPAANIGRLMFDLENKKSRLIAAM